MPAEVVHAATTAVRFEEEVKSNISSNKSHPLFFSVSRVSRVSASPTPCMFIYIFMCIYTYVYIYMCISCIHAYLYVHVCVGMYVNE